MGKTAEGQKKDGTKKPKIVKNGTNGHAVQEDDFTYLDKADLATWRIADTEARNALLAKEVAEMKLKGLALASPPLAKALQDLQNAEVSVQLKAREYESVKKSLGEKTGYDFNTIAIDDQTGKVSSLVNGKEVPVKPKKMSTARPRKVAQQ